MDYFIENKNVSLGKVLKELRKKNGLTQQEAAEKLGIKSKSTISMWETGKTTPDVFTFLILCCTYNLPEAQALIKVLGLENTAALDFAVLAAEKHNTEYESKSFSFCPFCGEKLPNRG